MSNDQREPLRVLELSASLRAESLDTRLAEPAATVIERLGGKLDMCTLRMPLGHLGAGLHPEMFSVAKPTTRSPTTAAWPTNGFEVGSTTPSPVSRTWSRHRRPTRASSERGSSSSAGNLTPRSTGSTPETGDLSGKGGACAGT